MAIRRFTARLPLVHLLSFALLILAAGSALAQPPSGRYQARPAGVLACGGIAGFCLAWQLEGSVDLEIVSLPFPGSDPEIRFTGSDLRLQRVHAADVPDQPFPAVGSLPLAALISEATAHGWRFVEPPGAPEEVSLELIQTSDEGFLLHGSYFEGCCDRFEFDLGNVIFDYTGPGGPPAMYLGSGRFRVAVEWQSSSGGSGSGTPVRFDDRSGRFWFFDPKNPELTIKVIDGCRRFGRFWFFAAGLTNVGVTIRVDDLRLGTPTRTYTSPPGEPFQPIFDLEGFPCIP